MNRQDHLRDLLHFIDKSPSPFHATANLASMLEQGGYTRQQESETFAAKPPAIVTLRSGSSLIAIRFPARLDWAQADCRLIGAHTDSPTLKIKSLPDVAREGLLLAGVEVYGGALLYTWFDRDLLLAGRLHFADGSSELVHTPSAYCRIPSLAIHLQREVNDKGAVFNRQREILPMLTTAEPGRSLLGDLARLVGRPKDLITGFDLVAADSQPSSLLGMHREFISAPRLDNLAMCHAAVSALLHSKPPNHRIAIVALFDHEEIGSETEAGAASDFLLRILERSFAARGANREDFFSLLARSILLSADMAHAVHPNFADKHDDNHKPRLNEGPVVKLNANRRYATSGEGAALLRSLADRRNIPLQQYIHRSDLACGSTIGPIVAARSGLATVDVGNPMLSMHSVRELAGSRDHDLMIHLMTAFLEE